MMMFIPAINFAKSLMSFILKHWEYVLIFALALAVLHYNTKLNNMELKHKSVVQQHELVISKLKNDISKANQQYLEQINKLNKQSSIEVEKLQEKHDNEIDEITTNSERLSASVTSLQQALKNNTKRSAGVTIQSNGTNQHSTTTESVRSSEATTTNELFGTCLSRYGELATIVDKQQVSIDTLQESWGAVRKQYNTVEDAK